LASGTSSSNLASAISSSNLESTTSPTQALSSEHNVTENSPF
jgi:hypothetical protein